MNARWYVVSLSHPSAFYCFHQYCGVVDVIKCEDGSSWNLGQRGLGLFQHVSCIMYVLLVVQKGVLQKRTSAFFDTVLRKQLMVATLLTAVFAFSRQ